jgi:hypothetical protein
VSTSSILRDNSKALYQPWREEAFRADEYVQALAPIERWMLRALLQAAFACSQRPYLPDNDARLWVLAGCESRVQWDQHSSAVRSLFTPIELDGQKLLSQKKLVEDWDRMNRVRSARAEAGRKGGSSKSHANNHQDGDGEKEKQTEAKQSEPTEPNQPNRSEVTEVSCLPIARVGGLAGGTVGSTPSGTNAVTAEMPAALSSGLVFSLPDSLVHPSANTATGRARSQAGEKPNPEKEEKTNSKGSGQGKKGLLGWESAFQREVQRTAADLDYAGHGVVFSVPLPDKVFQFAMRMSEDCGMVEAQAAVIRWLESRSFNGLDNPNVVWAKMDGEVLAFVDERIQRDFRKASCAEL